MEVDFSPRPHEEAIALIKGKPVVTRAVFDGLLPELRGRAFTITGVEGAKVMQRVRDSIAGLAGSDRTWDEIKKDVVDELEPYLGEGEPGGPNPAENRAVLLMRTHGFQAFQASNWRTIQADGDTTHIQYLATEDDHVRDTHLALNGLILPKDDPFWESHFPPWEWGCRCRTRGMNPDLVDDAKQEDESRNPDDRLVMEGPALEKLNEGHLQRDGQTYDVTPPADTNEKNPYQWNPGDLKLPLDELEKRYDPEVWAGFKEFAQSTKISPRKTVWQWLSGKPAKAAAPVPVSEPPKGASALPPTPNAFPESTANLQRVRALGGSTGAELVKDPATGRMFVLKHGNSAAHVREEFAADQIYRAAGVPVPEAKLYEESGKTTKLAEFIEGKTLKVFLGSASAADRDAVFAKLQENFHMDALLGNWDVVGLELDNVLVDEKGIPWRIDNGGSLRYRAQGALKSKEEWNNYPTELWSLRDAKTNAQTGKIFGGADFYEIAKRLATLDTKVIEAAPEEVRTVLQARMDHLRDVGRKGLEYQESQFKAPHADRITEEIIGLRKAGVLENMASAVKLANENVSEGQAVTMLDENGKAFDHLRSAGTTAAPMDKSEGFFQPILKAVKTINHHHEKGDTTYNQAALSGAQSLKHQLTALQTNGTAEEKKMAAHYLETLAELEKAQGKISRKISVVKKFELSGGAKPAAKAQSVVEKLAEHMKQQGGDWKVISDWAEAQAGSSKSTESAALKRWLFDRLDAKPAEFWNLPGPKILSSAKFDAGGKYDRSFEIFHAFVQEMLGKMAFPGNDRNARLMRILRTERNGSAVPFGPGQSGVYKRGVNESGSVATWFSSGTKTMTVVPHVRVTSSYFLERTPGAGGGFLLGDGENEFTYMAHGLKTLHIDPKKPIKADGGMDSSEWLKLFK